MASRHFCGTTCRADPETCLGCWGIAFDWDTLSQHALASCQSVHVSALFQAILLSFFLVSAFRFQPWLLASEHYAATACFAHMYVQPPYLYSKFLGLLGSSCVLKAGPISTVAKFAWDLRLSVATTFQADAQSSFCLCCSADWCFSPWIPSLAICWAILLNVFSFSLRLSRLAFLDNLVGFALFTLFVLRAIASILHGGVFRQHPIRQCHLL